MPWIDWLVVGAILLGGYRGYKTGAMRQVLALVGWFVAFVLALQLMRPAGQVLLQSLPLNERFAPLVGFLVVLALTRVAFFVAGEATEALIDAFRLSFVNRLAGGGVGAIQAVLLLSLFFLVLRYAGKPSAAARRASQSYAMVADALPATWDAMAKHAPRLRTATEQFGQRVEDELPE